MRLSVLDQAPIVEGSNGPEALRRSVDLARHVEALGYHRYWVAEHHGMAALASPSPEILLSAAGAATSRIRLGSGGVMLPHYAAFKVAENFSMLAGLYPGRVDIGLGRANGSDQYTAGALRRTKNAPMAADDFPEQLTDLLGYLGDDLPQTHPYHRLASRLPGVPEVPSPWLLGSSPQSAIWAGERGLPYCFADFINPYQEEIADLYRSRFVPSRWLSTPSVMVAVIAIAGRTDEEADYLSSSIRMALWQLMRGKFGPLPTPARASAFMAEAGDLADPATMGRRMLIGSAEKVVKQIERVALEYGADEVMLLSAIHDHEARKHSYSLVAEAAGLTVVRCGM